MFQIRSAPDLETYECNWVYNIYVQLLIQIIVIRNGR